eukprot:scaffold275945_cov15-Tisochrysis_lutea.AAC.1
MLAQRQASQASSPFANHACTPTQHRPRTSSVTSSGSSSGGFGTASLGTDVDEASLPLPVFLPTNSTTTPAQQQQQQQQQLQRPQALHPPSSTVSSHNLKSSVLRGPSAAAKPPPTHHTLASKPAWVARLTRNACADHDDDASSSSSSSGYGGERIGVVVRRGRLGARLGSGIA